MAKISIEYAPNHKQATYAVRFNPSSYAVGEAGVFRTSFEECLDFITDEFTTRTKLIDRELFSLELSGEELPEQQKIILERLVEIYNRPIKACQTASQSSQQP